MSANQSFRRLFSELKRRRVFRVALVYAAVAWALIEIAGTVAEPLSLPPWFVTFVIIVAGLGFPIAVVLAWAFDVNPADTLVDAGAAPGPVPLSQWLVPLAVAVVVAGGLLAFRSMGRDAPISDEQADHAGIESIAVLPFLNISSDAENEHFGDGLTEELLNSLAQIPGLRVAARTSSFVFKGDARADITEIGARLNVESVLEGSIRRVGNRVRITAQLIHASDGHHLWSKTYEREMQDIFAIQDEISAAIVQSLGPQFATAETHRVVHPTENVEAYDLYLQGRYRFWQGSTEAGLRETIELLERAVAIDSGFSVAYAGLSDAYMLLANQVPPREAMPAAKAAAERALALDPRLAEGYVALASINWLYDWEWAAADQNYRLSFSVNPLLHTRCICYAWYLAAVGNHEAAVIEAERAREMDPLARLPRVIAAWMYYLADRPADARAEVRAILETSPTDVSARRISAWLLWDEGRRDDALNEMHAIRDQVERTGSFEERGPAIVLAELAVMYAATGWHDEARRMRDALRLRARNGYVPAEYVAAAEAAAGETDAAFATLARAVEDRSNLGQFSILPVSSGLRSDARYRRTLHAIGLGGRAQQLLGGASSAP